MRKTEYGISVYPDFYGKADLEHQIVRAAKLGYTRCFTSIQLGNLGFEHTKADAAQDFQFLFDLCDKHGLIVHADINDRVLKTLGGSPNDLKVIADRKIKVLRLDGGFSDEEVARMTANPYHIVIEDNTSMVLDPSKRIDTIKRLGNLKGYAACHNFFPRNDTGLAFEEALRLTRLYSAHGIQNGIFIASLTSPNDLNGSGNGVPTIEEHRYCPPHIAFSELRNTGLFDYILFGDSVPSDEELKAVSDIAQKDYVEIPVWLDKDLPDNLRKLVTETTSISRPDQPESVLRATRTRGDHKIAVHNAIRRPAYSITLDNVLSNRYEGELQITLKDLDPSPVANVIGMVKPYGHRLVDQIKQSAHPFKLKEE